MSSIDTSTAVTWRDYLELCKPNVVALMILTSVIGMLLATEQGVPVQILLFGNLGIALCAGSAAAVIILSIAMWMTKWRAQLIAQ